MPDATIAGFGTEPQEVSAVLDALVGAREEDDDAATWWRHLSSRQALLTAAVDAIAVMRRDVIAELYEELGSYGKVAERLGTSRSFVQKAVEAARA